MRDVVARHFALLNGDVHDLVGSSAIANCVNMGHVSLHMGVGQNRFQCGIHARFFQTEAADVRDPAKSKENLFGNPARLSI